MKLLLILCLGVRFSSAVLADNDMSHLHTLEDEARESKMLLAEESSDFLPEDRDGGLLVDATYETGERDSGDASISMHGAHIDVTADGTARTGTKAIRHELNADDPDVYGSKRCESDSMSNRAARIRPGVEQFYGFSIMLNDQWVLGDGIDDIVIQWKAFSAGPHMMITQKHSGLFLRGNTSPDPDYVQGDDSLVASQFPIVENVQVGVWNDIVVRVKWEFEAGSNGVLEVYHKTENDSEYSQVVTATGPNCLNRGGYLKWGVYKPYWKTNPAGLPYTKRVLFHDNVRIGASFDEVDPSKN